MKPRSPAEWRAYRAKRKSEGRPLAGGKIKPAGKQPRIPIGLDGEGVTDPDGAHRYVMLSYSDESGKVADCLEAPVGGRLSTRDCLRFLWHAHLENPHALWFGFSLGYDWTKILEDLPDSALYKLQRPETRPLMGPNGHRRWAVEFDDRRSEKRQRDPEHTWLLDAEGMCTTITKFKHVPEHTGHRKRMCIWDMFKFCAKSFVKSVGSEEGWDVVSPKDMVFLKDMKARRGVFRDDERDEMRRYNFLECRLLAALMRKLIESHRSLRSDSLPEGLTLTRYDGPGSSTTAVFDAWGLKPMFKQMKALSLTQQKTLKVAIASAFFGGRFENRVVGRVWRVRPFDINSAYPAEICSLPCVSHGKWRRSRVEPKPGEIAIVQYELKRDRKKHFWGPFPFREEDGSICFPIESGGGWVWNVEYWAAKKTKFWPGIKFKRAWVFERTCQCPPALANMAELYMRRDEVGKMSGEGQVLKLAMNSGYGKMAQSVGAAPFQTWIWAGLITAGTRACIIEVMCKSGEEGMLGIATDGVLLTKVVDLPAAPPTLAAKARKPLGGWDTEEPYPVFLVRPGIAIGAKVKARGIGRTELEASAELVKRAWKKCRNETAIAILPNIKRFMGLKQGVRFNANKGTYARDVLYGRWHDRSQYLGFHPRPKRERVLKDGTLTLRRLPGLRSLPYERGLISPESAAMRELSIEELDQPDVTDGADFGDEG